MGQQDVPSPFSLQSPVCFFYLAKRVVLQLNAVERIHTHFSSMFPSKLSVLLQPHQRINFSFPWHPLKQIGSLLGETVCVLNRGHLLKPSEHLCSNTKHWHCYDASDAAHPTFNPFLSCSICSWGRQKSWSDRKRLQNGPWLSCFSHTRTWDKCYNLFDPSASHLFLFRCCGFCFFSSTSAALPKTPGSY